MARPARFNADYYTHSADLRNDRRVKAIRTAYGAAGYGLFIMLLEALTDADNTALPIDEMELELLAGDFGVSATDIHNLSQFGIKVGYFTTNEAGLLTCPELNSWLAPVFDKRNRARNAAPAGLPPQDNAETGVSVTVNPQSKVKKSKVNTTNVVAPTTELLLVKSKAEIIAGQVASDGGATFTADNWPGLNDAVTFDAILKDLGYVGINAERYRLDIRATVRANGMDVPAPTLRKFIKTYLNRESANAPLMLAPLVPRSLPVMPDDPCSLWGVPNPDYDHRTYSQLAGQYTGTIE